jgi:hypothetical protein
MCLVLMITSDVPDADILDATYRFQPAVARFML